MITQKPLTVWITRNWKILKEMGIPDHLICLLRNFYAVPDAAEVMALFHMAMSLLYRPAYRAFSHMPKSASLAVS